MNKKVLIKTEGCDIYKHGFVYDVLELLGFIKLLGNMKLN